VGNAAVIDDVVRWLDLSPRLVRLLSAVHEAGHAVVADTVGMGVSGMHLTDDGSLDATTTVDYRRGAGEIIPLPDMLAMRAAGFQAMFTWLDVRGLENDDRSQAVNYLAAGDNTWCKEMCDKLLPGATMQDGVVPAVNILQRRWLAVMRLAYALARAGTLGHQEISELLATDAEQQSAASAWYLRWRDHETADRWYRREQTTLVTGSKS
jgi:hypothetical protein